MSKEVTFETLGIFAWPAVALLTVAQVWFAFFTPVSVGEWLVANVVRISLAAQVSSGFDIFAIGGQPLVATPAGSLAIHRSWARRGGGQDPCLDSRAVVGCRGGRVVPV